MEQKRTIRILSLDGGGMKGYASARFLELFLQAAGIDGSKLYEYFDIITGTSIGGISALAYAHGMSPTGIKDFFTNDGPRIFNAKVNGFYVGRAGTLTWSETLLSADNEDIDDIKKDSEVLYGYGKNDGYGQEHLKDRLNAIFGNSRMEDLKVKTFITAFNVSDEYDVLFSNVEGVGLTGKSNKLSDVGLATSAAPIYFKPVKIGNKFYIDGGTYENDTATTAYSLARWLYPLAEKYCVLSVGTGLDGIVFPDVVELGQSLKAQPNLLPLEDALKRMGKWLGIGIGGPQESVNKQMQRLSNSPFENLKYYRFNFNLKDIAQADDYPIMDRTDADFLNILTTRAEETFNNDRKAIDHFIEHMSV